VSSSERRETNEHMTALDIAQEIWTELDSPSDYSATSISYWLKTNVGKLNIALRTSFGVQADTMEILPELDHNQKAVLKMIFMVYYYDKLVRSNLGAAASDVLQVTQAGKTVKLVNRNEVSKVYATLRRETQQALDNLIHDYRRGKIKPVQVAGDDNSNVTLNPASITKQAKRTS
jgi:hypothetical protein